MKIKHWMTRNPITVKPSTLVVEASRIMKEHGIRRLPVVDKDKVVGIVTHRNLLEAAPSAATTLSVHELNYLIANMKVEEVMRRDPICVSPEDSVIDAIRLGQEKGIGSFPVVDRGRLVGIVTETEIIRAFLHLLGDPATDSIVVLENVRLRERIGAMSRIASIIEGMDVPVLGMFSLPHRTKPGNRLHIRVHTKDTAPILAKLEEEGYRIGD
jgi:acetoin utilization protein AcuB